VQTGKPFSSERFRDVNLRIPTLKLWAKPIAFSRKDTMDDLAMLGVFSIKVNCE
jgi:hypothetical protein